MQIHESHRSPDTRTSLKRRRRSGTPRAPDPVAPGERTNRRWLSDLRSEGSRRELAVGELEEVLRAGLARALGSSDNVQPQDLDDFTQEALIRILESLDSFRGDSRFTTWAMTIALRSAYTVLRSRRSGEVSLDDLEEYGHAIESASFQQIGPPVDDAQRNDLYEALRRAVMEQLTERQRTVILAEMRGVASNRIAEMLGTNRNAVYKTYYDARKNLRGALTEAGFTAGDVRSILAGT